MSESNPSQSAREAMERGAQAAGYAHPAYAASHAEFGEVRRLAECRGSVIVRRIQGSSALDAMGCYPLFACADWSRLHLDLKQLGDEVVSLVLVADPFGDYEEDELRRCFPDLLLPFKEHYVVDLEKPRNRVVSKHHRYEARKSLRELQVRVVSDPPAFLDTWLELHAHLVAKHSVEGVAAFSRTAFASQLATPGVVVMVAELDDVPIAAIVHYVQGEAAYAHLLGCSPLGYEKGALYALLWSTIEHFSGSVRWLDLMGVPGSRDADSEGIRQFKRGWTRETRLARLCGVIFDRPRYAELVRATHTSGTSYFPAYRDGELA